MLNDNLYVPFEDGLIFETQGYHRVQKCEFCGKPAQHANCHAHKKECPLHCNNLNQPPNVSINGGVEVILFLLIGYFIYKLKS